VNEVVFNQALVTFSAKQTVGDRNADHGDSGSGHVPGSTFDGECGGGGGGVVGVASADEDDTCTAAVVAAVQEVGTCWVGATRYHERTVMRLSVCSWMTTPDDIDTAARSILECAKRVRRGMNTAPLKK
jgi:hypothetical protein